MNDPIRDSLIRLMMNYEIKKTILDRGDVPEEKLELINKRIIEVKREYRRALKGHWWDHYLYPGEDFKGYGEIVFQHWDYDSGYRKIFFKDEHWTPEEMKEFIDDNWHNATPSQYDCTGQIFTWAIDCFNVPSGVVAYIREAIDV